MRPAATLALALAALLASPSIAAARDDRGRGNGGGNGGGSSRGGGNGGHGSGNGGGGSHGGGSGYAPPGNGWGHGGNPSAPPGNGWGRGGNPSAPPGNGWGRGGNPSAPPGNGWGRGGNPYAPPGNGWGRGGNPYAPPGNGWGRGGGAPAPAPGGGWYPPAPVESRPNAPAPYAATAPAPAPYREYVEAPAPFTAAPTVEVAPPPWWFGWDWGWGYYPLFPRPAIAPVPDDRAERIATTLSGGIATSREGSAIGGALAIEGRTTGFDASIDGIAIPDVTGSALGSSSAIGLATMHFTWSILSEEAFRVRLETGASMTSMPSGGTSAGMPWAGKVSFGPDLGVSGHVGLVGPIGIEGYARVTPVPVTVTDTMAAVALRGGPLALSAGWRSIRVMGDGVDALALRFAGPEVRLALNF